MKKFTLLCAAAATCAPTVAFAQSTGTTTTEEDREIVVTGTRAYTGVDGVVVPDTTKAKGLITQELIQKQNPGQTILNVVNLIPSVNFTNSDPYGSSGGNIRIRGFDGNRISLTFDGLPLNDSGNYAIYSNQQLDPELVEQVNVGLGVTDVDSPTASAAGGTINYRTLIPSKEFGGRVSGSLGRFDYRRLFGMIETGEFTSFGTRAWVSASMANNDKFKGPGEIKKRQYNARIYQPLGTGGDFISVAGHYNKNRNNFYRNPGVNDLRTLFGTDDINPAAATADNPVEVGSFDGYDLVNASPLVSNWDAVFNFENDPTCASNNNTFSGCSNYYNVRINPSNTGNIRGQSRFTLSDQLTLTVDPSYQYVLANGGGTFTLSESSRRARGSTPASLGVDFNGDGDYGDTVRFYTPNITNTHRYGLTSSLIYDITPQHRVRVAYTYDRAKHRQTGEWSYLEDNGDPANPFSGRNAEEAQVFTADGFALQQRDRKSIALLNQISGQYIGKFFDNDLRVELGLRRPFFKRDLETFCPIQATDGFAYCTSEPILPRGTPIVANPAAPDFSIPVYVEVGDTIPSQANGQPGRKYNFLYAPFKADYKFGKILPNFGFTYRVNGPISIFGSYAKGFSAPRTDNLYRAPVVEVDPEETNAFDLGVRYTNNKVQAQGTLWKIDYKNRIVTSFNPDLGISIDRNVGKVNSWGVDGSIAYRPIRQVSLLALASYIDTELKDNVQLGTLGAGQSCDDTPLPAACAPTKGKMVTETPHWQFGGRVNVELGAVEFGIQGKNVGSRFATDVNDIKVKPYAIVDLDARINFGSFMEALDKTYLQLNLQNLFDKKYFGNISTQINAGGNPSFAVGSPRTFSATLNVGF